MNSIRYKLVSYSPVNEGSGTRRCLLGGVAWADPTSVLGGPGLVYGTAAIFNAVVPNNLTNTSSLFAIGNQSYTIAVWISPNITNAAIISKDGGGQYEFDLYLGNTGQPRFYVENTGGTGFDCENTNFGNTVSNGRYLIIAKRNRNAETISIRTNNTPPNTIACTGDIRAGGFTTYVGSESAAARFTGSIGPLITWTRAISLQEDSWIWNNGVGRKFEEFNLRRSCPFETTIVAATGKPDWYYRMMRM